MISILHGADLHLDSPFSSLTPEQAAERRKLQRQLPQKIVELAKDCELLLLAGDVFDGRRVCPETVESLRQALETFEGHTFIVPGNHDPYGEESLWAGTQWPERVHIFKGKTESVVLPELGCRVWGAAYGEAFCPQVTGEYLEIGLYHGDPYTVDGENYLPVSRMENLGLDYLALGHIHKRQPLTQAGSTRYAWPGSPMGRGFDECGVRGVYRVELGRENCHLTFLPIPGPRYENLTVSCQEPWAESLPEDSAQIICRLTVTGEGEAPLPDLSDRFLSLELRDRRTPLRDLWEGAGEQSLRGIALEQLKQQYGEAEGAQQEMVALAAKYLIAALEGREAP